jgi:glycosyltransferase involved in cell wall biosynthesis
MISVIIPSMNNADVIEGCLQSALNAPPNNKEIIVVDAYSKDGTTEILQKYEAHIKIVYDTGEGLGLARNLGIKYATGDIIAFLDPDVICAQNHFQKIEEHFNSHPETVGVSMLGKNLETGTVIQRLTWLFRELFADRYRQNAFLHGWNMALRRSVFHVVGGFWRGWGEDTELSFRLKKKGLKIALVACDSIHIPRTTVRALMREMRCWGRDGSHVDLVWNTTERCRKLKFLTLNAKVVKAVVYLLAPYTALKYLRKTKSIQFYFYFILRQYAYVFGYIFKR